MNVSKQIESSNILRKKALFV
uniref:Uncharacterized protein n=1 Tax=Anguilla anguilla TaxID=7936 RepID=A0A0E9RER7_ANGAN